MATKSRFWDNIERAFHKKHRLFYLKTAAVPTTAALASENNFLLNSGTTTGGRKQQRYKAVRLSGGAVALPGLANVQLFGPLVPGAKVAAVFPSIPITINGVTTNEDVEVQYTIQSGDANIAAVCTNLAAACIDVIEEDTMVTGGFVRCTNIEANLAQIAAGLLTTHNDSTASAPEEPIAVASSDIITFAGKVGEASNDVEVGFQVLDKPPSPLTFIPGSGGVPNLPGIQGPGNSRAFKANFTAGDAEILADQDLPALTSYINSIASGISFEAVQDDDPRMLEVVSGVSRLTNDNTRDYLIPASRDTQQLYSLFFVTPSIIEGAYDYLWCYGVRSAGFEKAMELRNHTPVAVNGKLESYKNRVDIQCHFGYAFA